MYLLCLWSTEFLIKAMVDLLSTLNNGVLGAELYTSASIQASHNTCHIAFVAVIYSDS
jgi:hypothetical protein